MSKSRNNIPRAAIHVGAPAKSFSAAEGYEPERRGWDENTYRLKNQNTNNHYDFSRKHLNFEINGKGEIVPLGSNPVPLHERLQKRLDELEFKPYMDKNNPLGISDNSPNCTVGIIVSGDHDVLTRLAFGDQDVDFTLQKSNTHVVLKQGIKDWALDTYHWACDRWGAENIIGFDVHLDETTPHIQIQTIPVAKTKARGRASAKYVHKDDKSKELSHKEWKKLPEEIRSNFIRTEDERREKECVSYASVWGKDKYAVRDTYYQMHTDYYNEVGHKYGLERGDDIAMLPGEERRERVHKNKAVLEAERQAKDAIVRNQMENERLEGQKEKMAGEVQDMRKQKNRLEEQKDKLEGEIQNKEQHKERLEGNISQLEDYAAALDIKEEDLIVPTLNTNPLVKKAWNDIQEELGKPIPAFGQKEWREDRRMAIKTILTDLQTALMQAKEVQKQDILKLGKALYNKAMQNASAIIEQNKQLQKENARLAKENDVLRKRIASLDENAIARLRDKKDAEIKELQERLGKAESEAIRSGNKAYHEHQRAESAETQVRELLGIPEIKEIWESIQQNKEAFRSQIDQWIEEGVAAIMEYANGKDNDFQPKLGNAVAWGIIAIAFMYGLDPTDEKQRKMATAYLLEKVSWTGISSDFKISLTASRTQQLCDAMTVSKDLMANLLLAAGGRGGISSGGGGSNGELTNWDGTKKKQDGELVNCYSDLNHRDFSSVAETNSATLFSQKSEKAYRSIYIECLIKIQMYMVYGYIRVSSDKQTVENQRFEINKFCEKQNIVINDWIEETISGTKNYTKRQLGRLLRKVHKDDIIICSELSRLGRNLFMIMEILNICMTKECRVWTIKDNYRLGDDIQSKVLAFAFGLSAEIERNLISQRTKEALARKKAEGAKLGHPRGFRCRLNPKCASKHDWIVKELTKGTEKTVIAKKLKVSKTTFYRYLVYAGLHVPINCQQEGWEEYGIYH